MAGEIVKLPMTKTELDHLAKVIAEVEQRTSGEIRLVVVKSSMPTGHVVFTLFGGLMTLSLLIMWVERHRMIWMADWWVLPALFLLCGVIAALFAKVPAVVRLITPVGDLRRSALARAELEFYREGLNGTAGATGILLFISVLEHQAVVLADKAISDRIEGSVWNQVVATMVAGAKRGKWLEKLELSIRQVGDLLALHLPLKGGGRDELPNHVIVKE